MPVQHSLKEKQSAKEEPNDGLSLMPEGSFDQLFHTPTNPNIMHRRIYTATTRARDPTLSPDSPSNDDNISVWLSDLKLSRLSDIMLQKPPPQNPSPPTPRPTAKMSTEEVLNVEDSNEDVILVREIYRKLENINKYCIRCFRYGQTCAFCLHYDKVSLGS
ncbi:hypothetical protein CROQUDRAFT_655438 [Cronartium quercuum f. sp. fusiforme G11]|uniref:Uncharacterized protein n=1 Tax=Cronartium quercuum f. sp. fusiforme G11 TaxID=708437 RepID=A0A9P6TD67_9BASI|nr:hypothetical protein CROQUDRAFT_655438 [Cronartium quercuum f. sp. fusiforme G11]